MSLTTTHLIGFGAKRAAASASGHLYWRITFTASVSGTYMEIAEAEMRVAGVDQTSGQTFTSSTVVGGSLSNMWDNSAANNVTLQLSDSPCHVTVQFSSAQAIDSVTMTARNPTGSYPPTAGQILYSDDGTSFTSVHSYSGLSWSGGETKTFSGW